ncbi:hypothetical protein F4775DRAFT_558204 [Biscogniauxia sp. FL1348]|nr:hypothetical protein F4775DRAFT_558204 [Biscogniauxia sp. FL1348]
MENLALESPSLLILSFSLPFRLLPTQSEQPDSLSSFLISAQLTLHHKQKVARMVVLSYLVYVLPKYEPSRVSRL